jgi:hypothetical protein
VLSLNRILPHATLRKSTGSISTKIIGQRLGEVLTTRASIQQATSCIFNSSQARVLSSPDGLLMLASTRLTRYLPAAYESAAAAPRPSPQAKHEQRQLHRDSGHRVRKEFEKWAILTTRRIVLSSMKSPSEQLDHVTRISNPESRNFWNSASAISSTPACTGCREVTKPRRISPWRSQATAP